MRRREFLGVLGVAAAAWPIAALAQRPGLPVIGVLHPGSSAGWAPLIAAFDTGIGTGSIAIGWMSEHIGFSRAFAVAALLAALSIPYYLYTEKRQWITSVSAQRA